MGGGEVGGDMEARQDEGKKSKHIQLCTTGNLSPPSRPDKPHHYQPTLLSARSSRSFAATAALNSAAAT